MQNWTELITQLGAPLGLLLAGAAYHVKTLRAKDREIRRINEARVNEQEKSADRMMEIASEFTRLSNEQEKTLVVLAGKLDLLSSLLRGGAP